MIFKTISHNDPAAERWFIGRLPDERAAYVKPGPLNTWRRAKRIGLDDTHVITMHSRLVHQTYHGLST